MWPMRNWLRRRRRLDGFPYSGPWTYFITFSTAYSRRVLARERDGALVLSPIGRLVDGGWRELVNHRPAVIPLDHVVMPDHFHGLLQVVGDDPGALYRAISCFKGEVTKRARRAGLQGVEPLWARSYYDHIVRNDRDLLRIQRYIADNPRRWLSRQ